jgi:transposase
MGAGRADDPASKRGGRRREVNVREVLNAVFYVLSTGCQWQPLPKDLPPKSSAHCYFMLWEWDGTLERLHHTLYVATREQEGREVRSCARSRRRVALEAGGPGLPLPDRRLRPGRAGIEC